MHFMHLPDFLRFASEATWAIMAGLALLAVSLVAHYGDRRRRLRRQIDAVGIMPWRDISALTGFAGLLLCVMGLVSWIGG